MSKLYRASFTLEHVDRTIGDLRALSGSDNNDIVDVTITGDTIADVMRQILEHVDAVYRRHRPTTNETPAGLLTAVTRRRTSDVLDDAATDLYRYFMNSPAAQKLRTGGIVVPPHCHRPLNDGGGKCHEPTGHDGNCDQLAADRRAAREADRDAQRATDKQKADEAPSGWYDEQTGFTSGGIVTP